MLGNNNHFLEKAVSPAFGIQFPVVSVCEVNNPSVVGVEEIGGNRLSDPFRLITHLDRHFS